MARVAIGGIVGLGLWLGSALAAEAQSPTIEPTGPAACAAGATSSTYTANVTAISSFQVRLRVHLKKASSTQWVQWHDSTTDIDWLGGTYAFSKVVNMTIPSPWGHAEGDQLRYRGRVWLASNMMLADQEDWTITVGPGTLIVPNRERIRERTGVDLA